MVAVAKQDRRAMARPRSAIKNVSDPRGQLGAFLRAWFDANPTRTDEQMAKAMGVSARAVRKWCEGAASPSVRDLDRLAKFCGMKNWGELAAAAVVVGKQMKRRR